VRRLRHLTAALTVLAFLAGQAALFLDAGHAPVADDAACGTGITGAHPTEQFEDVRPGNPLDHCTFCHLQRAIGSARLVAAAAAVVDQPAGTFDATHQARLLLTPRSSRDSRGPPPALL
jgi:hypothetical protein